MPYLVVEDFKLGQDTRKSKATSPPGTLRRGLNCHVTKGGELEKRKAFVSKYELPADTFGLAQVSGALYVMGSAAAPSLPSGVNYLRCQHPTGEAMSAVLMVEVFNGRLYVAAEFADASVHHFYQNASSLGTGDRVTDWVDGRARGRFTVAGGSASSGVQATTQFEVTGGTASAGTNKVLSITINGVEILGAAVDWVTSNSATATAIASQITSYSSTPNYTAAAVGAVVTITHPSVGITPNGYGCIVTVGGNVTVTTPPDMAGGEDASQITSIKVNGVEVLNSAVNYSTTAPATATAIAAQINSFNSVPEYTASAQDNVVFVIAASGTGTTPNGYELLVTDIGDVDIQSVANLSGGIAGTLPSPGSSVRTVGTKMYTTSGPSLYFSKVDDPTKYTSDQTGAGFINMSNHAAGSEELTATETFYGYLAVFAKKAIQIWSVRADDSQNAKAQDVKNNGTRARRSVIAYGEGDVVFLGDDGIRAIKARDSSNSATVSDLGTAIDADVDAYVDTLEDEQVENALALIEPKTKRLWMIIGERIYVYSFSAASKISAWTEYEPGFEISDAVVVGRQIYVRSEDTIYLYGGDDGSTYGDDYVVRAELPFIDGKTAATFKNFSGIDIMCEGVWTVEVATDPRQEDEYEEIAIITGVTNNELTSGMLEHATHISPRLTHQGEGYARLSRIIFHYENDAAA